MHVAQLISNAIYYLQGLRPQDTQWTRRSPTGSWGFQLWLWASVSYTECPSPPARSSGPLLTGLSSRSIAPPGRHRARYHNSLGTASSGQQMHHHHLQSPPQLIYKGWSVSYDTWPTNRQPSPKPKITESTRPVTDKSSRVRSRRQRSATRRKLSTF